mmetsp:Transcript_30821/g.47232  ORF Transcript_30821/g.47232 Transcript_30821/m.47232 type:complete len:605 (+) Transcript_30821:151-1965(+)
MVERRRDSIFTTTSLLWLASILSVTVADECSIYLAETLSDDGQVTMGVFSSIDLPKGSMVGFPDAVVPLVDVSSHNSNNEAFEDTSFLSLYGDIAWDMVDVGGLGEGQDVYSVAMGLGSLVRGDSHKWNVMPAMSEHDTAGLHRSRDAGVGAFTNHHSYPVYTLKDVKAGEELFFPSGYHWNTNQASDSVAGSSAANNILSKEFRAKLWHVLQQQHTLDPSSPTLWENASILAQSVLTKKSVNSNEFFQEHGQCMTNLRQGVSTIPQAGRGAFATNHLKEGSVIAPAPVIHISEKAHFTMYHPTLDVDGQIMMTDRISGTQLMLNYCFGHRDSTKLLCPVGASTSYINHSPTPNAAIRWTTANYSQHKEAWFNMSIEELKSVKNVGLVLEYVAIRDIADGEEIFINYGPEWEEAWKNHVGSWEPTPGSQHYLPASDFQHDKIIKTEEEQEVDPYPENIMTTCSYHYNPRSVPAESVALPDETYAEHVFYTGKDEDEFIQVLPWNRHVDTDTPLHVFERPCILLGRDDENNYDVQLLNDLEWNDINEEVVVVITNVPREAVALRDAPYSTDANLPNAFRHEMRMSDAMFPERWKNLKISATSKNS